jgi:hypothetical protein
MEATHIQDTPPPPPPQQAPVVPEVPPPSLPALDEAQVMTLGLDLAGFVGRHSTRIVNNRRFRAHYGIGAASVSAMYNDLRVEMVQCNRFLLALNFLKLYDTEHVLSGRWKLDERMLREIIKDTLLQIQNLKEKKIVWGEWEDEELFVISVDGVHCRVREVRKDPGAKWFDHKSHGAGVTYELGIAIRSGNLVWIKGPFPASTHDITMFRGEAEEDATLTGVAPPAQAVMPLVQPAECLKDKLDADERAIGDTGYRGEPTKVSITRPGDSAEVKKFKARVKSRHETFNARIKSFNVLNTAFRHAVT